MKSWTQQLPGESYIQLEYQCKNTAKHVYKGMLRLLKDFEARMWSAQLHVPWSKQDANNLNTINCATWGKSNLDEIWLRFEP